MEKEYGRYPLSVIFPKIFAYLNFVVPVIRPEYLTKPIPNPIVILKDECIRKIKGTLGDMDKPNKEIILYLYGLMNCTFLNRDKFNLDIPKNLTIFCRYIDSLPKLQTGVIHEYEHIFQFNFNNGHCLFKEELGINVLISENVITSNFFMNLAKDILKEFKNIIPQIFYNRRTKTDILIDHLFYYLEPTEIEARLSEIIYLRFLGYDKETISKLDTATGSLGINLARVHFDIEAIKSEIKDIKYKGFTNVKIQRDLSKLQERLYVLDAYSRIYDKLFEIVDRYVEILKLKKRKFESYASS